MNTLFVGIDVSTKHNQSCAINFDQKVFFNLSFDNTPDGSNQLIQCLLAIFDKEKFDKIIVVAESTSVYDYHVCNYLLNQISLLNIDITVYSINAKMIKNYRKSFVETEKTDPGDALICADFARVGRTKSLVPFKGAQVIALKRLTRERFHLGEQLTREKNYTLNNVYLKMSGLLTVDKNNRPFSTNFSATNSKIISDFLSPDEIEDMPLNDLISFLEVSSKNRCDDYEQIADLLKKAMRASYRLDKAAYDPITTSIASSLRLIQCINDQIKIIDKEIERCMLGLFHNEYLILTSIKGIGKVYAAGILAEIGSIDYFKDSAALSKYAGFYWDRNDSGNFKSEDKKSKQSCNQYLKYYIGEATASTVNHGFPFTKEFYDSKYAESKTHKHKRALVLTSKKLTRLLFTLLRDKKMYVDLSQKSLTS